MAEFIALIGQFFYTASPDGGVTPATGILAFIPQVTGMIITDPLLVLPFVLIVIGFIVGILGRILQLR